MEDAKGYRPNFEYNLQKRNSEELIKNISELVKTSMDITTKIKLIHTLTSQYYTDNPSKTETFINGGYR